MRLTYWYSACVTIETPDARILCDPWFGWPGANNWDGAWAASPLLPSPAEILNQLGAHSHIYLSHVHDDHYCPEFLRLYLGRYPQTRLIVPDEPHLLAAMGRDGFAELRAAPIGGVGGTEYAVVRYQPLDALAPIDSALAVTDGTQAALAMNDCPYDQHQVDALTAFIGGRTTLACLPYLGAGEYPQTYEFDSDVARATAAAQKREQLLALFERYLLTFRPIAAVPYAGEYWLCGPLATLNARRGLPDAIEAVERAKAIGMDAGAFTFGGTWDLDTGRKTGERFKPLDLAHIDREIARMQVAPFKYQRPLTAGQARGAVPALLRAAARRIAEGAHGDTYWYILGERGQDGWWGAVNLGTGEFRDEVADLWPREEVRVDVRYAALLLSGLASWNVALGGSHLRARRHGPYRPDIYERLNWLRA